MAVAEGTISNKEEMESQPQNLPHLLLIIKAKMFKAIESGNFIGYCQMVSTFHSLLSSFHDEKYLKEYGAICELYNKNIQNLNSIMFMQSRNAVPIEMKKTQQQAEAEKMQFMMYQSNSIVGALGRLEARKNLLMPVTTTILEEDPDE